MEEIMTTTSGLKMKIGDISYKAEITSSMKDVSLKIETNDLCLIDTTDIKSFIEFFQAIISTATRMSGSAVGVNKPIVINDPMTPLPIHRHVPRYFNRDKDEWYAEAKKVQESKKLNYKDVDNG